MGIKFQMPVVWKKPSKPRGTPLERQIAKTLSDNAFTIAQHMDNKTRAGREGISATINNHIKMAQETKSPVIASGHMDAVNIYRTKLKGDGPFRQLFESRAEELQEMSNSFLKRIELYATPKNGYSKPLHTHHDGAHMFVVRRDDNESRSKKPSEREHVVQSFYRQNGMYIPVGEDFGGTLEDAIATGHAGIRQMKQQGGLYENKDPEHRVWMHKESVLNEYSYIYSGKKPDRKDRIETWSYNYTRNPQKDEKPEKEENLPKNHLAIVKDHKERWNTNEKISNVVHTTDGTNNITRFTSKPPGLFSRSRYNFIRVPKEPSSGVYKDHKFFESYQKESSSGVYKGHKISNLYEAYAQVYAKNTLGVELDEDWKKNLQDLVHRKSQSPSSADKMKEFRRRVERIRSRPLDSDGPPIITNRTSKPIESDHVFAASAKRLEEWNTPYGGDPRFAPVLAPKNPITVGGKPVYVRMPNGQLVPVHSAEHARSLGISVHEGYDDYEDTPDDAENRRDIARSRMTADDLIRKHQELEADYHRKYEEADKKYNPTGDRNFKYTRRQNEVLNYFYRKRGEHQEAWQKLHELNYPPTRRSHTWGGYQGD